MAYGRKEPYDYYAVVIGVNPGIYSQWDGPNGAKAQVDGHRNQDYKGFYDLDKALAYYREKSGGEEPERYDLLPPYRFFAITNGIEEGIYDQWYGGNGALYQITGYKNPCFKCFHSLEEAQKWFKNGTRYEPKLKLSNEQE